MCNPAAIAVVAVSTTETLVAGKAANTAAEKEQVAAEADLYNKYNANQAREQQEMQRAQLETYNVQQRARSNTSRIRAQIAAGGVSGATASERAAQPGIEAENIAQTIKVNLANELRQNQLDAKSFQAEAESRINEAQGKKVSQGAEALSIAGQAASAAAPLLQGGLPTPKPSQAINAEDTGI